jgi:hypothetical protein
MIGQHRIDLFETRKVKTAEQSIGKIDALGHVEMFVDSHSRTVEEAGMITGQIKRGEHGGAGGKRDDRRPEPVTPHFSPHGSFSRHDVL